MALLILYFLLAVGVSFLCSILEAVLLSLTPSYVSSQAATGSRSGRLLERQKRNVDRPLAAILSLNTAAHTVGAAGVGAQALIVFENVPVSAISGVLTLLILVFSEIIPKTLGATYWRSLSCTSAYIIQLLTIIMWPLVVVSQSISRLLTPKGATTSISRDEISAMAELGREEGVIDQADAETVRSVIQFQSVRVKDVFTPRTVAVTLDADQTVRRTLEQGERLTFSRLPVMEGHEGLAGYVLKSDLLMAAARDEWDRPVRDFAREVLVMTESMPLKNALREFLRKREHLAVVVDEYGSYSGVISLEDALETLIGSEIMDEVDTVEDLRKLARGDSVDRSKKE